MNLVEFSTCYRVRVKRDECGETIIPGKRFCNAPFKSVAGLVTLPDRVEYRSHIFDYSDGKRFGVLLLLPTKRRWNHAKKNLRAAGFEIHQDAETEGTALFDPTDLGQVRLALRIVGAKRKRTASPAQLQALKRARAALRIHQNHCAEGVFAR